MSVIGTSPPSQDPWADERAVYAVLEKYKVINGLDCIPVQAFTLVAGRIAQFKRHPVTHSHMAKMKAVGKQQLERREILDRAAEILQDERREYPGSPEHVRLWSTAIGVLKMPRGITETPGSWIRGTKQGQPIRAWTYMATEVAGYVLQVLRGYGVEVSMGRASGLVKFIREALEFIGVNDLPSDREISEALQKNLDNSS